MRGTPLSTTPRRRRVRARYMQVKWSIVENGRRKWPLHFSGLFEATCVSGLTLSKTDVVLAISCRGLFLLDEPFQVLVGLHYYELVDAIFVRLPTYS